MYNEFSYNNIVRLGLKLTTPEENFTVLASSPLEKVSQHYEHFYLVILTNRIFIITSVIGIRN